MKREEMNQQKWWLQGPRWWWTIWISPRKMWSNEDAPKCGVNFSEDVDVIWCFFTIHREKCPKPNVGLREPQLLWVHRMGYNAGQKNRCQNLIIYNLYLSSSQVRHEYSLFINIHSYSSLIINILKWFINHVLNCRTSSIWMMLLRGAMHVLPWGQVHARPILWRR